MMFPIDDLRVKSADLDGAISEVNGPQVRIVSQRRVGGGSINDTSVVNLSNGVSLFVKRNNSRYTGLFEEEARGLRALRSAGALLVPRPIGLVAGLHAQILLMEYIESGTRRSDYAELFGRSLAELHRSIRSEECGFDADNHIGSTPQLNEWDSDWYRFFGRKRLGYQVRLARDAGRADATMVRQTERVITRLPELLPPPDDHRPSLLHGDLWGGNAIVGPQGEPTIIDPAVYFGHREADLAMTELFGGFSDRFYRAYREEWPLEPGYSERRDIYNLYHLLNHLNLFGSGYAGSCRGILRRFG